MTAKIKYEPHPVSPERKRELNAQGFKIIDARFAPVDTQVLDGQSEAASEALAAKAKRANRGGDKK